jgi:hypothetical protein
MASENSSPSEMAVEESPLGPLCEEALTAKLEIGD